MIRMPWQLWVGAALGVLCFVAYKVGQHSVQVRWDAAVETGKAIVEELEQRAQDTTTVVETKVEYRDRIIEVEGKERTVVREVFVPDGSCELDGGFRLYHDAAATNTTPDPTRLADAAPTAATDVAATIDTNYQLCHRAYARLELWDEWYADLQRVLANERAE